MADMIPDKNKITHKIKTRLVEKTAKGHIINDRPIGKVIKQFIEANVQDNKVRFNIQKFVRNMEDKLPKDKADDVIEQALRPYNGKTSPNTSKTASDDKREERKLLKKRMRSRRN